MTPNQAALHIVQVLVAVSAAVAIFVVFTI